MVKLGYRCEWCGMTTHSGCRSYITNDCTFGVLQPIYLPPHGVSIPRTEVPMEAIIGVQVRSRSTPLQRDYSCRKYFQSNALIQFALTKCNTNMKLVHPHTVYV